MRLLTVVPALVTLGLVCNPAVAQTTERGNSPPAAPQGVAPDAPVQPLPGPTAEPTPPPYPASPSPTAPSPTSPDRLVSPPGSPPPFEPQPPPPAIVEPPPPAVYHDGRELSPGARRPPRYRYVEGTPLPEGYHLESRVNRGLVFGGAAMVGIPYLIGAFGTLSVLGEGNTGYLAIPVIGPWLTLANRSTNCGEIGEPSPGGFECFSDEAGNGLLIASGVMQALGTAMIVFGVLNTREYAVADYAGLHITPVATPRGDYGLVVSGTL
jgi:hypothetical protein